MPPLLQSSTEHSTEPSIVLRSAISQQASPRQLAVMAASPGRQGGREARSRGKVPTLPASAYLLCIRGRPGPLYLINPVPHSRCVRPCVRALV